MLFATTFCLLLSKSSWALPLQVTSLADVDLADGTCTLREAVIAVNNGASYHGCFYAGQTVISLPAGSFNLSASLPDITATVTITGAGHASTIIDGANSFSIGRWILRSTGGAYLTDLTLRNFALGGPWIDSGKIGGLSYVKIENTGNATSQGGCLMVQGQAQVDYSQLEGCRGHTGAAIRVTGTDSRLWLHSSTVLKSRGEHGIIAADTNAAVSIDTSTIASNQVGAAAGIAGEGAVYAGGSSSVSVWNSTIAYNTKASAAAAGGGTSLFEASTATLFLSASVVFADQASASDCAGGVAAEYSAFASGRGCPTSGLNFAVNAPQLQPLTATETTPDGVVFGNLPGTAGGVGRVYLPSPTSPLIGLTDRWNCASRDQRGVARQNSCTVGSVHRATAAMVVGNTTLSAADAALRTQLENLGFAVTLFKDTAVTAASVSGSTGVVVISESVGSANVNTKLRDVDIGVLVLEPSLFDDMNMTTAANLGSANQTQTFLLAGSLASTMGSLGAVTATTSSRGYGYGLPVVGSGQAIVHAYSVGGGTQDHIFEYPAFNSMVSGFVAPNARVGAFMTENASGALNSVGARLFQEAAIRAASYDTF